MLLCPTRLYRKRHASAFEYPSRSFTSSSVPIEHWHAFNGTASWTREPRALSPHSDALFIGPCLDTKGAKRTCAEVAGYLAGKY